MRAHTNTPLNLVFLAVARGIVGAWVATAFPTGAQATYSIAACDLSNGECGVAVQTDNLAVGASVPYAQAGVGAIASQFETNPRHGPRGLALLAEGKSAADVLQQLLREDGNFEGHGVEVRQVAIVSANGQVAVHTGADAEQADWAGSRTGNGYSLQGNGLVGPQVLESMERAFLDTAGPLATRLLAALSAGDHAGGQRTGRESAALVIRTRGGFPLDIDLRVDHADDPVGQLRFLYDLQTARQDVIQARIISGRGKVDEARALLISAIGRAASSPRVCVEAAKVADGIEQPELALQYLALAFTKSPERINRVIGGGDFAALGADPTFHRWVGREAEASALANAPHTSTEDRLTIVRRLLEVGRATEALVLLNPADASARFADLALLRATAHSALGNSPAAIAACEAGLEQNPDDSRLRLRLARLRTAP